MPRQAPPKAPRPMCFVAMPFRKKAPPGKRKPVVDFDRIAEHIRGAVEAQQLEYVKADLDPSGGFVHRQMYERLIVAEYVIADVTFGNANVLYEVGVRHGTSVRPTIMICADASIDALPFDIKAFKVIPYSLTADGALTKAKAAALEESLRERLRIIREGRYPPDNPIVQVTAWQPCGGIQHEKTDVFLQRLKFAGDIGARITDAVLLADATAAVARLHELEDDIVAGPEVVTQLHTALLGVYIGYRERKAYEEMLRLYDRMPGELQQTAVAREQRALALNRLAEAADARAADELRDKREQADAQLVARVRAQAGERRAAALATLDQMPPASVTSETYGIRGRIHKGAFDAAVDAGTADLALARLGAAIEAYEAGMRADLRDYYPGVNAVTLRLRRGTPEDLERVRELAPVVRFAVEAARAPRNDEERYWQTATRLELASAARDWPRARQELTSLLGVAGAKPWMHETTAKNLAIQREAFRDDAVASQALGELIDRLH